MRDDPTEKMLTGARNQAQFLSNASKENRKRAEDAEQQLAEVKAANKALATEIERLRAKLAEAVKPLERLAAAQEPLDAEASKAIFDDVEALYERDAFPIKAEAVAVQPLEWKLSWGPYDDGDECHIAGTPFGSYSVKRIDGGWIWGFCFDEYYDEDEFSCGNLADGKRSAEAHWQDRCSDIVSTTSPVPAITDDARVKQLEAEKSILMGAITFAIETDEADTFLRCFTDGSADEDEEWKDWQEFKANLVLHGTVAKQAFPELPATTDKAVERAAYVFYNAPVAKGRDDIFADYSDANTCREVARAALLAAFPGKGEGE